MNVYDQMDELIKEFNFKKVRKVMKLLDWKYYNNTNTPTKHELKSTAKYVLETAYHEHLIYTDFSYCETGGFRGIYYPQRGTFKLFFIVESSE